MYWRFEWNLNLIVARRKTVLIVTGKMRFGRVRISGTLRFEELTCLTCIYIFATIDYQLSILPPLWHITSDNLTMFSLLPFEENLN